MDGTSRRFDDSVKDLGEAIARLSISIDELGERFGVNEKKDEEIGVYEWEKDDCVERFARKMGLMGDVVGKGDDGCVQL